MQTHWIIAKLEIRARRETKKSKSVGQNFREREGQREICESEKPKANLKDPLVHDNNGDIEPPPLKDGKQRSKHAPLEKKTLLHLFLSAHNPADQKTTHQRSTTTHFNFFVLKDSERD